MTRTCRFSPLLPGNLLSFILDSVVSFILSSSFSSSPSSPSFYRHNDSEFLLLCWGCTQEPKCEPGHPYSLRNRIEWAPEELGTMAGRNTHAKALTDTDRIIK